MFSTNSWYNQYSFCWYQHFNCKANKELVFLVLVSTLQLQGQQRTRIPPVGINTPTARPTKNSYSSCWYQHFNCKANKELVFLVLVSTLQLQGQPRLSLTVFLTRLPQLIRNTFIYHVMTFKNVRGVNNNNNSDVTSTSALQFSSLHLIFYG